MNVMIRHILVPVDFSAISSRVVDTARTLAGCLHADVHLLHVVQQPFTSPAPYQFHLPDTPMRREQLYEQARGRLARIANELRVKDLEVTTEVRIGTAAAEIVKAATDYGADLVVMGTHGRAGLQHFLSGSVAEEVIRRACCPVLSIRDHGGVNAISAA